MKIYAHPSRKYKDKDGDEKQYYKYTIVLSDKLMKKLKWKGGDELEAEIKGDKLILEKD